MTVMNKKELRRRLRASRGSTQERDIQSAAICRHILTSDAYAYAKVIAGYAAMPHEANIAAVLEAALAQGKTVVMPLCGVAPQMTLRMISSMDELCPGKYGIPEPPMDAPVMDARDVDLILVPLEGIDHDGYRMGKGGGYYDCLLGKSDAYSLGCALSWQCVEEVPRDSWDKPLSACADMHGIHEFRAD
ncbi:MAG: 5-formyltetrahydrofolate cyclo-ligase [Clostridia bacterium]|nr:5-formyltetrahydrofolate cyclo-ligase [Clostridia bacterium]